MHRHKLDSCITSINAPTKQQTSNLQESAVTSQRGDLDNCRSQTQAVDSSFTNEITVSPLSLIYHPLKEKKQVNAGRDPASVVI